MPRSGAVSLRAEDAFVFVGYVRRDQLAFTRGKWRRPPKQLLGQSTQMLGRTRILRQRSENPGQPLRQRDVWHEQIGLVGWGFTPLKYRHLRQKNPRAQCVYPVLSRRNACMTSRPVSG